MNKSTPLSAFTHTTLPDSKTHIRLLEIIEGKYKQHVVCKLSTWPLDAAPPYYAISYTWGDPTYTADITVNERHLEVGRNCEYVLHQAFFLMTRELRYYWIDAICIDQTSTLERGHQVSLMGKLYQRAMHVLACVGPHSGDSEFLVKMCKKKKKVLQDIHVYLNQREYERHDWSAPFLLDDNIPLMAKCYLSMLPWTKSKLVKELTAFMERPYFSRVWILQELHMGIHVTYCCGRDVLSSGHVFALSQLLDPLLDWYVYQDQLPLTRYEKGIQKHIGKAIQTMAKSGKTDVDIENSSWSYPGESQRGCLALASSHAKTLHLRSAMAIMDKFQCTDDRDKLYGILSLVDWSSLIEPVPDYSKDTLSLAVEVFGLLAKEQDSESYWLFDAARWAQRLIKLFNLTPKDEAIRTAFVQRYDSKLDISVGQTPYHHNIPRILEICRAVKIYSPLSRSRHYARLHCSEQKYDDTTVMLVDGLDVPFARVPSGTRANDWYLELDPSLGYRIFTGLLNIGLIVRRNPGLSSYTIIGVARRSANHNTYFFDWSLNQQHFKVFWHAEDIMLLFLNFGRSRTPHSEESLTLHVCGSRNSSFAQRLPFFSRGLKVPGIQRAKLNEIDRWTTDGYDRSTTDEFDQPTTEEDDWWMTDGEADTILEKSAVESSDRSDPRLWYNEDALRQYHATCENVSRL
jgi:hypothetical protein